MSDNKETAMNDSDKKFNQILKAITQISGQISNLDTRISKIEEKIGSNEMMNDLDFDDDQKGSKFNYNDLDQHLKDTYDILSASGKPMTASDVAEKRGLSRSTISYHLNQLVSSGLASKNQGRAPDSKKVFFESKKIDEYL